MSRLGSLTNSGGNRVALIIVEVRLGRNDDSIDRQGPFMVISDDFNSLCFNEWFAWHPVAPQVIAQLAPDEDRGRFEATWAGEWRFGRRVQDA
jgi:hypothetical protein